MKRSTESTRPTERPVTARREKRMRNLSDLANLR